MPTQPGSTASATRTAAQPSQTLSQQRDPEIALASTPPREPAASPLQTARALGVVFGGPFLLDALEVLGPLSALGRWPRRLPPGRVRSVGRWLTAAGVLAPFLDHLLVRPALRRWGSAPGERSRRLAGDPAQAPLVRATRAVTVYAPAEEVWRWLVQIGQDRGGFYSYDWLENLAGCRLHSAEEIREEWQHRAAGDTLTMFPGVGTTLTVVQPPHALVIEGWGAYVIEPRDDASCRLLARSNVEHNAAAVFYLLLVELPRAILERRMLLGIKHRAEAASDSR